MNPRSYLSACLLAALLAGCNDGGEKSKSVAKDGYGEAELYDPVAHPGGALLPQGATALLQLEAAAAGASQTDTGAPGYDEVWFDWSEPAPLGVRLEPEDLKLIARLELRDHLGGLHVAVDGNQLYTEIELPAGRYQLLVYSAHRESQAMSVFVGYMPEQATSGESAGRANARHLSLLRAAGRCTLFRGPCDLSGADLAGIELIKASLTEADLSGANLSGARLMEADLSKANLSWANLSKGWMDDINLSGANLLGANLSGGKMARAKLPNSNLSKANLSGVDLAMADLTGADLSGANLSGARMILVNLTGADLSGADLTGARLDGATWTDGHKCPNSASGGPGSIGECP